MCHGFVTLAVKNAQPNKLKINSSNFLSSRCWQCLQLEICWYWKNKQISIFMNLPWLRLSLSWNTTFSLYTCTRILSFLSINYLFHVSIIIQFVDCYNQERKDKLRSAIVKYLLVFIEFEYDYTVKGIERWRHKRSVWKSNVAKEHCVYICCIFLYRIRNKNRNQQANVIDLDVEYDECFTLNKIDWVHFVFRNGSVVLRIKSPTILPTTKITWIE